MKSLLDKIPLKWKFRIFMALVFINSILQFISGR